MLVSLCVVVYCGCMVQDRPIVCIEVEWQYGSSAFHLVHFSTPDAHRNPPSGCRVKLGVGGIIEHWNYYQTVANRAKLCSGWTLDWCSFPPSSSPYQVAVVKIHPDSRQICSLFAGWKVSGLSHTVCWLSCYFVKWAILLIAGGSNVDCRNRVRHAAFTWCYDYVMFGSTYPGENTHDP